MAETASEVFAEFARVSKMIEGTSLRLLDVFKYDGQTPEVESYSPRNILGYFCKYTFALAIVEGKPVFVGDTLWSSFHERLVTISSMLGKGDIYLNIIPSSTEGSGANVGIASLSWCKPKPATFTLNGEEFPLPDDENGGCRGQRYYITEYEFTKYRWKSAEHRDKVAATIHKLLSGK